MEVIHVNSIEEIYALRWNMGKMTFRSLSFFIIGNLQKQFDILKNESFRILYIQ